MAKRNKRNRYLGRWIETACEPVSLSFSNANLKMLLQAEVSGASPYTHQQIADWAWRFWRECDEFLEGSLSDVAENDPQLAAAVEIASDIDAQWDGFLTGAYSLEQLQQMDFSQVRLPPEWFKSWLAELDKQTAER